MKIRNDMSICRLGALLSGAAMIWTLAASAQPDNQRPPEGQKPPEGRPQSPQGPGRQFQPFRDRLGGDGRFTPGFERIMGVLTEEQRSSFRQAMEGQREKMRELEEKIREARKELFEVGLAEKFDEDAVRKKAMESAKLDAERTVLMAKAFSQVRPQLTAEQTQRVKSAQPGQFGEQISAPRRPDSQRDEHGLPPKDRPGQGGQPGSPGQPKN